MTAPIKLNLKIYQGATFIETLRWESSTKVYKPITHIDKTAPVVIHSTAHGIPIGWRTKVSTVNGMKEINSGENYYTVTGTTADTVIINSINAINFSTYNNGGILEYNAPVPLANYTGRMQIRRKLDSPDVILELTSANNRVLIDSTNSTITLIIAAEDTAALDFSTAVYSLELVKNTEVIPFINGTITLIKEVTR